MEFTFDINIILPLEITILNGDYRILNHGHTARILSELCLIYLFMNLVLYLIGLLTN